MGLRKRWTSRVLLIDKHDRLLLLCGRDPRRDGARWWFTVGGGVEDGEDYVRAAIREVREETALRLPADRLGPVVWTRQTLFSVDGQGFDQYEEYRVARVTAAEVAAMRVETDEARYGHRWWPVDELAVTRETVRPKGMGGLLPPLLGCPSPGRPPLDLGDFDEDEDPDRHPRRRTARRTREAGRCGAVRRTAPRRAWWISRRSGPASGSA
ncbi:NUDIX domain-containing protein [Streptomyces sp. NBC_01591]|uniref:NUDIX hydrolase n=1 Tax=Streptomyces sp. NBC_01591 TaxID=2975888 RepID=UPI002DD863FF|nr:NUDIX domain-containing protein [Streptomyces sp. NBC_01591]WSD68505.1 NUDIX domain-containing protein [Streptomyces sp. NBC_01591]